VSQPRIAVIGGSGLGEAFGQQVGGREVTVETPFGQPSGPIILSQCEGIDIAFISRHGPGHLYNPTNVPYRANIYALKQLGVTHILASGATGSLREEYAPGHLVICDQVIDKTHCRVNTFFDEGIVAHVEFAQPFCPKLRTALIQTGQDVQTPVHSTGTYVCMEGPQFSTVAESRMHQSWGGDLIGMTAMPEAKLAREAEMCYALIGLPTDYDCWRPHDPGKNREALLQEIIGNLQSATHNAIELLHRAIPEVAKQIDEPCSCRESLQLGIWSDKTRVDPHVVDRLRLLVGHYFAKGR